MKIQVTFVCGHTHEFILSKDPTLAKQRAEKLHARAQREECPDCSARKGDSRKREGGKCQGEVSDLDW